MFSLLHKLVKYLDIDWDTVLPLYPDINVSLIIWKVLLISYIFPHIYFKLKYN